MQDLTLTLVQVDLCWEAPTENIDHIDALLSKELVSHTDIILLPEMFTTGFSMGAAALAEPLNGKTTAFMRRLAQRYDALVGGSFIRKEAGAFYNSLVFAAPNGALYCYDKRHLFRMAGEHNVYSPGKDKLVITWRGWRLLPLVCYDLRFPVWSRNDLKNSEAADSGAYDLLLYVANWPAHRAHHWKRLLKARAIENQAFVAACNRVGTDGNGIVYSGDSLVADFHGELMCHIVEKEGLITQTLDAEALNDYRIKFPAWLDADDFQLLSD
jgi:predicted amidohydrolase